MENDLNSEAIQDATYTADIDDEDYTPPESEEETETDTETEEETETEQELETEETDDDPKMTELETKLSKTTEELEKAQKEINRLGYALRKSETKPEKEQETPFTEQELMKIYKEHSDDPDVQFQVLKEMAKQGKVDAQEAAEKSLDIKNKKTQMNTFIESIYPDATKEGTDLHTGIQQAIEWAHLEGHPFAEHLALGLLTVKNLPDTIKKIKEDAKQEYETQSKKELEDKAEKARKTNINKGKTSKPGKSSTDDKSTSLSPTQLDTAKRLGITDKKKLQRYAKIVGKKGETVHAEA